MKTEHKINIQANRLIGEFIGTLEGVCLWEIPEELKLKLQSKIKELRQVEIISFNLPVIGSFFCYDECLRNARECYDTPKCLNQCEECKKMTA